MKTTTLASLCILLLVHCTDVHKEPDTLNLHQIYLMSKVSIKNMEYSIAVEVSGFQDKVLFLQVYKGDISGSVNTNKIYNRPIFVEPLSKYNERNHVVFPNEVAYNSKDQALNVKYADGDIEQFEFKL